MLLIALTLSAPAAAQEARSAMPDAPVVAHVDKVPMFQRTRRGVATALRYLADVVAPKSCPWGAQPSSE
jgi:hypothetical protein